MATTGVDERVVQQARLVLASNWTEQQKGRELLGYCLCRAGATCHSMGQIHGPVQAIRLEEAVRQSINQLCEALAAGPQPVIIVPRTLLLNKFSKDTAIYHTEETLKTSVRSQKSRLQHIGPVLDKA